MLSFPRNQFSTFIKTKQYAGPVGWIRYDVVDFKQVLAYYFPKLVLAIDIDIHDFRKPLIDKFGNDRDCFKQSGVLQSFNITSLRYYQTDTGIDGPKFHQAQEPVSVIKSGNILLLWEGYHRVLRKIIEQEPVIRGYILEM
jgi:hypothetical protein